MTENTREYWIAKLKQLDPATKINDTNALRQKEMTLGEFLKDRYRFYTADALKTFYESYS